MTRLSLRAPSALLAAALLLAAVCTIGSPVLAAEGTLPGMCNGRTDPNMVVVAVANGREHPTKFILSLTTDAAGTPTGTLILGQGPLRIEVTQWCRLWLHVPGQAEGGSCEHAAPDEDAVTAHAVGVGVLPDGQRITLRADVRETDEGAVFRVRYRVPDEHHDEQTALAEDHDECEGGWVRIPIEGWLPLQQLNVRAVDVA
jgi:hypothetical protein